MDSTIKTPWRVPRQDVCSTPIARLQRRHRARLERRFKRFYLEPLPEEPVNKQKQPLDSLIIRGLYNLTH